MMSMLGRLLPVQRVAAEWHNIAFIDDKTVSKKKS